MQRNSLIRAAKHAPLLSETLALGVAAGGDTLLKTLGLLERNAERLSTHAGGLSILSLAGVFLSLAGTHVLDLVLTLLCQAVGNDTDVLVVQSGNKVIPVGDLDAVSLELRVGAVVQVRLDGLKQSRNASSQLGDRDAALAVLAGDITAGGGNKVAGGLTRTELNAQRDTAELVLVELPAGGVAALITVGTDTGSNEDGDETVDLGIELLALLLGSLGCETDRDDDNLDLSHTRRQDETLVVTVDHDHNTQ